MIDEALLLLHMANDVYGIVKVYRSRARNRQQNEQQPKIHLLSPEEPLALARIDYFGLLPKNSMR